MKETKELTVLLSALKDWNLRKNEKGHVADCPVCQMEEKGTGKLLVNNDGVLLCMRYAGQDEEMRREHRDAIMDALGVRKNNAFTEIELGAGLVLKVSKKTNRNKSQLVLVEEGKAVRVDSIRIDRDADRKKFLKSLELTPKQSNKAVDGLIELASKTVLEDATEEEEKRKTEYTGFFELPDGRIGEMTRAGFAVYDPDSKEAETVPVMEYGSTTYMLPLDKIFFMENTEGIQLAPEVIEYGDTRQLLRDVDDYMHRYIDMPDFERTLASIYAFMTYIAEKTFELPYYRIVGATGTQSRGSGKSRLAAVLGRICYRPFSVTDPSAASTYRLMDKYHPTLVIDEFNFNGSSDDAAKLIMILNTGFERGKSIPRVERDEATGEMIVTAFSPYGAKIVSGLSVAESNAFESRCIRAEMQKTTRRDIEFRTSRKALAEADELRGKLTLWRLRNWHRDWEKELADAEESLKGYAIEPRYIQIGTPLYALLDDEDLRSEFAQMLVERTEDDAQFRRLSPEGVLVNIVHALLFEEINEELVWKDRAKCIEDEPCELLALPIIAREYNNQNPDQKPENAYTLGKKFAAMSIHTKQITRKSVNRSKAAVVFNIRNLLYYFNQFNLMVPDDFVVMDESEKIHRRVAGEPTDFDKNAGNGQQTPANDPLREAWDVLNDDSVEAPFYAEPPRKTTKTTKSAIKKEGVSSGKPLSKQSPAQKPMKTKELKGRAGLQKQVQHKVQHLQIAKSSVPKLKVPQHIVLNVKNAGIAKKKSGKHTPKKIHDKGGLLDD